jgi:peptide/nickel transport system substrate-binding protein
MNRLNPFLLVCILLVMSASPLSAQQSPPSAVIGWPYDRTDIDPRQYIAPTDFLHLVCEGLVGSNSSPGSEKPLLATGWTESQDSATYTFNLRQNVTFHDGSQFDAADVVYSFKNLNGEGYRDPNIEAIQIIDNYTIQFGLKSPSPDFILTLPGTMIIPSEAAFDSDFGHKPACTGEYMISDWNPGAALTLTANPAYWDGAPAFQNLTFDIVPDTTTRQTLYDSHQLDVALLRFDEMAQLSQWQPGSLEVTDDGLTSLLTFNLRSGVTNSPMFRQAVSRAIDRSLIAQLLFGDQAGQDNKLRAAGQFYPPNLTGGDDSGIGYDPDAANQLLDELGAVDTNGDGVREYDGLDIQLQLAVPASDFYTSIASVVADNLSRIGIQVSVDALEFNTWLTQLQQCQADMTLFNDRVDYTNFNDLRSLFNGLLAPCGYTDSQAEQVFSMLNRAASLPLYSSDSVQLYLQADRRASTEDWLYAPLVYEGTGLYVQPDFQAPASSWWWCYFCRFFC